MPDWEYEISAVVTFNIILMVLPQNFKNAIEDFEKKDMKGLVLDLRGTAVT